jgi:proteic killer suppression protein
MVSLDDINAMRYCLPVIQSFACKETRRIFEGEYSRKLPGDIQVPAQRKLAMLHFAAVVEDLRVPPGNRLEVLKGDRRGQCSIRINQQWRICFRWTQKGPEDVEIVDYH